MSPDVDADLNRELDCVLRSELIAKAGIVGFTAGDPYPLRLRK